MVEFKVFSRLKYIFSRFNPLNSFDLDEIDVEIEKAPTSDELLERTIKKYPNFEKIIFISIYHLINTQKADYEYLTVLTKDLKLIADLIEGEDDIVSTPDNVKKEGENNNILVASHNHFFGAIIPSVEDIVNAIEKQCQFITIVSKNHIGVIVNEFGSKNEFKSLIKELILFNGYIDICFEFEKSDEVDELVNMGLSKEDRKKLELEIYDKFISFNTIKFVDEFNNRFNKYNIYEIYIEI